MKPTCSISSLSLIAVLMLVGHAWPGDTKPLLKP